MFPTREEAILIVNRFDNNQDGRLTFNELQEMFNPKDRATSEMLESRAARNLDIYYPRGEYFVGHTRDDFIQVLRFMISVESAAERLRQRLSSRPLFNNTEAFTAFDKFHKSFITKEDFADLLAQHRFFATEKELVTLTDRFDKNKDGRVTYSEFV